MHALVAPILPRVAGLDAAWQCFMVQYLCLSAVLPSRLARDIDRIAQYPSRGFHVPHALPSEILASWNSLIAEAFAQHLLPDSPRSPQTPKRWGRGAVLEREPTRPPKHS